MSIVAIETYLQPGDHMVAMPRTAQGQSVDATVIEVRDGIPGAREIVLVRTGQSLEIDGAVGINERDVIIRVERGDCWIGLSPLMTMNSRVIGNATAYRAPGYCRPTCVVPYGKVCGRRWNSYWAFRVLATILFSPPQSA